MYSTDRVQALSELLNLLEWNVFDLDGQKRGVSIVYCLFMGFFCDDQQGLTSIECSLRLVSNFLRVLLITFITIYGGSKSESLELVVFSCFGNRFKRYRFRPLLHKS